MRLDDHKIDKEKIRDILIARKAILPCSRCGENQFTLYDEYVLQDVSPTMQRKLPVKSTCSIPSIVLVCNNCGYMSQHAVGVLESTHSKE